MLRFGTMLTLLVVFTLVFSGCAKKTVTAPEPVPEPVAMKPAVVEPVVQEPATAAEPPMVVKVETESPVMNGSALEMILFDYDSHLLTTDAKATLAKNAAWLRAHPQEKIVLEGYCDERGSDEYNLALGERRALEARKYLASLGIGEQRCAVVSFGEERPVAEGHDEISWAMNRRVEFK